MGHVIRTALHYVTSSTEGCYIVFVVVVSQKKNYTSFCTKQHTQEMSAITQNRLVSLINSPRTKQLLSRKVYKHKTT